MPQVQIVHSTEYTYRRPVGLLPHRLMLRPQDSHDLRLHAATLTVEPAPASTRWAHDVFGNSICRLEWPDGMMTDRLGIVSTLELTHFPAGAALPMATLDPAAEFFPFSYAAEEMPDLARLTEHQWSDPGRQVDQWARRFLSAGGPTRTLPLLEAMTHAIRDGFLYEPREAEGTQGPAETLARGAGTCRDFAMLMMEAARSLGLAARFITGYLYDGSADGSGTARGGAATHAWCAIYLPGAGWVEYDPTNGHVAGTNLIRIGATRAPQQASPVAGGFVGDPADPIGLRVDVSVRVDPEQPVALAA